MENVFKNIAFSNDAGKDASGYDTSGLLFSDEVGSILTCAGNSVTTIKSMRCLVLPQSVLRTTAPY